MTSGYVAHNHQAQHVDGRNGQEEHKLHGGDAIEDVVHLQIFLILVPGMAMVAASGAGVVGVRNPLDYMSVSHSCFLLVEDVRSES